MSAQLDMKLQLARQSMQAGRLEQAEAMLNQLLTIEPGHPGAGQALAMLHSRRRAFAEAIAALEQTLEHHPNNPELLAQIAHLYKDWGRFDEARAFFRTAAEQDPGNASHHLLLLASTSRFERRDADVDLIEAAYAASAPDSVERRRLAFALGKIFDDLKEYRQAFACFDEGNRIAAEQTDYYPLEVEETFAGIAATMNEEFFAEYAGAGSPDATPIFITGMPRSGTSLAEQILASHPDVYGAGELNRLTQIMTGLCIEQGITFPGGFRHLDAAVLRQKGESYAAELSKMADGHARVTDKSISSFIYIGLIRVMLPNAKIIVCRRDPRDIGLSIFQLDFGFPFPWSFRQEWIGAYYRCFDRLAGHWQACLPGQLYEFRYEDMVENPDREIRALLAYCGLEFDPACLDFHLTDRAVKTASHAQVRKPVYKGSVGRWKNYAEFLGPLIAALDE